MSPLLLKKLASDAENYNFKYDPDFDFNNRNVKRQASGKDIKIKEKNIKQYYEDYEKKRPDEDPMSQTFQKQPGQIESMIDLLENNQKITDEILDSKPRKNTDYTLSKVKRDVIKPDAMRPRPQFKLKEVCEANEYPISLQDFDKEMKLMGKGTFGEVYKARCKLNNSKYALKILNKEAVKESGYERHIMREKDICHMLDHPNIVRLDTYFHDSDNCYFAFELCDVGDLSQFIREHKRLSTKLTREFTMEIILALEHMRKFNIVHRDLKPQNILLDDTFHIKIADFGAAKQIDPADVDKEILKKDFSSGDGSDDDSLDECSILSSDDESNFACEFLLARNNTLIGSPMYTSPEMLRYQIACFASDLWALGCIIFECLVGRPPFVGSNKFEVEDKINNGEFEFPHGFNAEAQDLILKLLKVSPNERLGAGEDGFEELKKHPFFNCKSFKRCHKRVPAVDSLKTKIDLEKYKSRLDGIEVDAKPGDLDNDSSPDSIRSMTFETVSSAKFKENGTDLNSSFSSINDSALVRRG